MPKVEVYCQYEDSVFTPAEVEAITGVSPLLQRTWQQRGFLGRRKLGRAACTAHELAQVMALRFASHDLKVDLGFIHEGVSQAAPSILYFALSHKKAWEVEGSREEKAAFNKAIAEEDMKGLHYLDQMVGLREGQLGQFLVRKPDSWSFVADIRDPFDLYSGLAGAVVLDLMEIGRLLVESPQRKKPLIVARNIQIGGKRPQLHMPTKKKG